MSRALLFGVLAVLVLIGALTITPIVCSVAESDCKRVLSEQGIRLVRVTGYQWFACGEKDYFNNGFVGIRDSGLAVEGVVCKGWFKQYTVRFK
jgi:hypothetical protein